MTIRTALAQAIANLDKQNIPGARLDAELLLAHAIDHNRAWLLAHDTDEVSTTHLSVFTKLIEQRTSRIPVVHLTGHSEFYGLDFAISPAVLTPRVETEQMVEWAVKCTPRNSNLIDIGTGSGAIAIAIAHNRPDLKVAATEVSRSALNVAKKNAAAHKTAIDFIESDLWANVPGVYQTVVTNLPYLKNDAELMAEVRREPAVALFGGPDGLDLYRRFMAELSSHMHPGGYLFTESDPWQHEPLITLARSYNLAPVEQGYFVLGFRDNRS